MEIDGFTPIRPESTPALLARRLREGIEQGRLKPGQQLVETELSKQFGVSRGVLREAAQRLTQEGLLVSRPNRGVFVVEFGIDEVFDIYTARLALERGACLKVMLVPQRAAELADALDELTDRLEACVAANDADPAVMALDLAFHERMVASADSPRLSRMYDTLATESRLCLRAFEGPAYAVTLRIGEHRAIAQAIRDGDEARLHRLLADHMDHAVGLIAEKLGVEASAQPE